MNYDIKCLEKDKIFHIEVPGEYKNLTRGTGKDTSGNVVNLIRKTFRENHDELSNAGWAKDIKWTIREANTTEIAHFKACEAAGQYVEPLEIDYEIY